MLGDLPGKSIRFMGTPPPPQLPIRSLAARYVVACGIFLAALLLRLAILPVDAGFTYLTFYPGVAICALLCGIGPTLVLAALSAAAAAYIFIPPYWAFPTMGLALPASAVFMVSMIVTLAIVHRLRQRAVEAASDTRRLGSTLRQTQSLLQDIIDTTDVMLVYLDPDFNFVWVNQAYARTCRMRPEDMVGKSHFALYPDAGNEAIFRRVRDSGEAVFFKDKPFEFPDQPERGVTYWDWSLKPHQDGAGRVAGLVFSLRETTAHVLAEQAARANADKFKLLIDGVPAGIAMLDRQMRYLAVSQRFLYDYGLGDANIIGRSHYDVFPEIPERWRELHQRGLAGETLRCEEDAFVRPDGHIDWVRWEIRPWRTAAGDIGGIIIFTEDVTAYKLTEDALKGAKAEAERANDAKSRFLGAVSHDLRQPVFAISLYADALETKLAPADKALAANLKDCVAGLGDMLSNLLDLSKLDAGVVKPAIRDFDLNSVLTKIVSSHAPRAQLKGLQFRVGRFGLHVRTDPVLLQRILSNLVANAVRYTDKGGILIGYRRHEGRSWIEVWDTGIGVPEDKREEIFEEFRQLMADGRGQTKGAGLGLAIVARTAALLGLRIRFRSRMGSGSMFAVELPPGQVPEAAARPRHVSRPLHIALVEDNAHVAAAMAQALRAFGHQVTVASAGAELLSALGEVRPDLLISDFRLGDRATGLDVVSALRWHCRANIPSLIVTGDTHPAAIRDIEDQGIRLLYKPVDLGVLWEAVAELTA